MTEWAGRSGAAALTLVCGLAGAPARAQELPGPAPSPSPSPTPRPSGLALEATLLGGWDTNPRLQPDGTPDVTGRGRASLAQTWDGPQWNLTLTGNGAGTIYGQVTTANRYDYGAGVTSGFSLSPRTSLSLVGEGQVEHTDLLNDPAAIGLVLPLTQARRLRGWASLVHRPSTRDDVTLEGSYTWRSYESESLVDSQDLRVGARFQRRIGPRDRLNLGYGFQHNDYGPEGASRVHTVAGGWSRVLGRRVTLGATGGADGRSFSGETTWTAYIDGALDVIWQRSSVRLSYRRGINPGPGVGQDRMFNVFGVVVSATFAHRLSLDIGGFHGTNTDPGDPDRRYDTDEAAASLEARLTPRVALTLLQEYRRRGASSVSAAVERYQVGLGLVFSGDHR